MQESLFLLVCFFSMALILGFAFTTIAGRTAGKAIDDAMITTTVTHELAEDVKFSTLKMVQVDTHRGEVTLTGNIHNLVQKEHAGLVADKVNGVVMVHNMLSVVPER